MKLDGKVAIVTGAGRGIGRAIALKLASEGARIVLNDLDPGPAQETLDLLKHMGGEGRAVSADLTAPGTPEALVSAATEGFGGLDIVVNNAGYIWNSTLQNTSDEQWSAMLDLHATAPFRLLRAAYGHFRETARAETARLGAPQVRKVVNISSVAGSRGGATMAAYASGKAAVIGLTKSLAQEWGRLGVTVNCVAFGLIDTRLTEAHEGGPAPIEVGGRQLKVGFDPASRARIAGQIPLGRAGAPADAAGAVYLFCIPESDFVTGQVLECTGGA